MDMKYYVIAGTREEFERFIRFKSLELWNAGQTDFSLSHFVYVDSQDKLRGLRNPSGWFYGTWMDNPNSRDILIKLFESINDNSKLENLRKICKKYVEYKGEL